MDVRRAADDRPRPRGGGVPRRAARLRLASIAAAIVLAFLLVLVALGRDGDELRRTVDDAGAWAPVAFVALAVALTCALFPFPVLAAAGGVLFGVGEGTLLSVLGGWIGAMAAFALARRLGAAPLAALAGPRLRRAVDAVSDRGFSAVLLLRVVPGVPRDLANYLCGLTAIGLLPYAAATLIGIAPRAYAYTALGGSLGDLRSTRSIVAVSVLVALGALGLALLARERRRARRARG